MWIVVSVFCAGCDEDRIEKKNKKVSSKAEDRMMFTQQLLISFAVVGTVTLKEEVW